VVLTRYLKLLSFLTIKKCNDNVHLRQAVHRTTSVLGPESCSSEFDDVGCPSTCSAYTDPLQQSLRSVQWLLKQETTQCSVTSQLCAKSHVNRFTTGIWPYPKYYMAYPFVQFLMTLNDLEGHSPVAGLISHNNWRIFVRHFARFQVARRVARSIGDSWVSCWYVMGPKI